MEKVVLITGASSGFGKLVASRLLVRGYKVYGAARRTELMNDLVKQGAAALSLDVTDDAQAESAIKQIIREEGRLDVLINNAGYGGFGMLECVSMQQAQEQFEVNVFGAMRLIKSALPHMRAQKSGRIINISSMAGEAAFPMLGWYGASKHALESLSDSLRVEVKHFNIKVILIQPGPVNTGFLDVGMKQLDKVEHNLAYRQQADSFRNFFKAQYKKAPGPQKTADMILKAIERKNPKTRYAWGSSKFIITARKCLPDKVFDSLVSKTIGIQ